MCLSKGSVSVPVLQEATSGLKEQLRQKEEQLQATRQQAAMLSSELRDAAAARDRTMSELYHARLGAEALRASLTDAQAECRRMQGQLEKLRAAGGQEAVRAAGAGSRTAAGGHP